MQGNMMQTPLLISSLIRHAELNFSDREIVTNTVEGGIHRYTYGEAAKRSRQLANALHALGVGFGDRVATVAWNTYRHFELYFGVSGIGAIIHTVNPRLHPDQLTYIVNHAEDKYVFLDLTFVPLLEAVAEQCKTVKGYVILTDKANMPDTKLPNAICYEELVESHSDEFEWPEFNENTASSLCYTSGTTGNPKAALYAHRSTILHTYAAAMPDALNIGSGDSVLPVVPMFHVNAWGTPYVCAMVGAKLVFPGPHLDGESAWKMLDGEDVTLTAAVPTVWLNLLNYMRDNDKRLDTLDRVVIGGSACPRGMMEAFQEDYGVRVVHAWGMTEMSPLGTIGTLLPKHADLDRESRYQLQLKQGRGIFGVEMEIRDEDGKRLPRDGKAYGELFVRGPWIAAGYYKGDPGNWSEDGWFGTGDVATIDPDGYMQITDRAKDVIKSGGEWISSIDLENIAMGAPGVAMAAVIGVHHPKWDERPLLIVVRKDESVTRESILEYLEGKIAKWWMPDDVQFVDEIPLGATGKMLKTRLRDQFRDYTLPTA
jgi:fatty-acyl-CoA synthase